MDKDANHTTCGLALAAGNAFDGAPCAATGVAATAPPPAPSGRASGLNCPPPELVEFARAGSVRQAAAALGLSLPTVHLLRKGYWPADPRRLLRAWSDYQGRTGRVASSWFLRRVRAGGVVPHAGRQWTGIGLAQCVGELVAVARMPGGALLAQTLELPARRIPLEGRS